MTNPPMFALADSIWIAVIAGLPATIASVATLVNSMRNTRTLSSNTVKIDDIHEKTNGMQEKLVAATAAASHASGMQDQRSEDRAARAELAGQAPKAP